MKNLQGERATTHLQSIMGKALERALLCTNPNDETGGENCTTNHTQKKKKKKSKGAVFLN